MNRPQRQAVAMLQLHRECSQRSKSRSCRPSIGRHTTPTVVSVNLLLLLLCLLWPATDAIVDSSPARRIIGWAPFLLLTSALLKPLPLDKWHGKGIASACKSGEFLHGLALDRRTILRGTSDPSPPSTDSLFLEIENKTLISSAFTTLHRRIDAPFSSSTDAPILKQSLQSMSTSSARYFSMLSRIGRLRSLPLYAKKNQYDDNDEGLGRPFQAQVSNAYPSNQVVSDDEYWHTVLNKIDELRGLARSRITQASGDTQLFPEQQIMKSGWRHQTKLRAAVEQVSRGLIEREEESRLVVLSLVASEHILLLGSPGTAKSILGRRLAMLCNGAFFQRLLTRFSTPDELFGPLSLQGLEQDTYRRCTAGFLPTASVAFLDEIFKANSAILNTLLTILNERKFDNGGGQEDCSTRCVVAASNELPETDELTALFDRFLLRKEVCSLSSEGVAKMLSMPYIGVPPARNRSEGVAFDELYAGGLDLVVDDVSFAADQVTICDHVKQVIVDLRTFLREELEGELPSDRRLVKSARLLKISAAVHGRVQVDTIDCFLLQHCMWQVPVHREVIYQWLLDNVTPLGDTNSFRFLLDGLRREIQNNLRKTSGEIWEAHGVRPTDIAMLATLREELHKLVAAVERQQANLNRHLTVFESSDDFLWMAPAQVLAVKQVVVPRARSALETLHPLLEDALALEMAISDASNLSADDRLMVVRELWREEAASISFSDDDLNMSMRDAKAKYSDDIDMFRKWKRARKKRNLGN